MPWSDSDLGIGVRVERWRTWAGHGSRGPKTRNAGYTPRRRADLADAHYLHPLRRLATAGRGYRCRYQPATQEAIPPIVTRTCP
jgi:hypothetical protein